MGALHTPRSQIGVREDQVRRELLPELLSEEGAGGDGFGDLLEQSMCDAFEDEIPDDELRRDFDRAGSAVRALLDRAGKQPAVQEDECDIAGLVKDPPRLGIGRQDGKMAGNGARGRPSPIQGPLQLHVLAVVDAKGRDVKRW